MFFLERKSLKSSPSRSRKSASCSQLTIPIFLKKYTPEWIKDAGRKMYVGVSPKWNIPKSQFNGLTGQSIDFFFNDVLSQVSPEQLKKLGIDKFTQNLTDMASKKAAFLKIAEKLEKMPASDLPAQIIPRKGLLGKIFPNKKYYHNLVSF